MKKIIIAITMGIMLCFATSVVAAEQTKAKPKVTAKKTTKAKTSTDTPEVVQQKLDSFAQKLVVDLNKNMLNGENHKEVKQVNGQYVASYCVIDKNSLHTSYAPPSKSTAITYVGYLKYQEVSYQATGKTKAEALAGPFKETSRVPLTELIKYNKGKWSY
ncbi:hypothetical protein [Desulfovibrio litoralis]|uniref:Uncharacterized protein n=1 Tax=Desulfovibrio litoralis DSM 11393 TaxID=1121455 RepID=A0A1M7TA12_9BACT|nr:hypothetical protein [Desulfovibrio litoralis]SHN67565.1 hypothetical protein SAMN02745728_01763 [Desulfovibrio litoralis DSM 11393]